MRMGIARTVALLLGLAYLAIAFLEALFGELKIGKTVLLDMRGIHNLIHWVVGLGVLFAYFAGELAAKAILKITGLLFLALTVWGLVSRASLGNVLGYDPKLPSSYNALHLATAVLALVAGLTVTRVYEVEQQA